MSTGKYIHVALYGVHTKSLYVKSIIFVTFVIYMYMYMCTRVSECIHACHLHVHACFTQSPR